jgi:type IV pilus assembly protein PilN
MIKINLLPYRERKKVSAMQRQIIALAGSFGAFILIIVSLHVYTVLSIGWLEKDVKAADEQLKGLVKIAGEMDVVMADKKLLEKKIEIISNLEKSRMETVLIFNEMTVTVPPGQVWLTSISEAGGNLHLDGVARDNLAIAHFMRNLEKSSLIKSVDLKSSKQDKISNTKIQKFNISCSLKKG